MSPVRKYMLAYLRSQVIVATALVLVCIGAVVCDSCTEDLTSFPWQLFLVLAALAIVALAMGLLVWVFYVQARTSFSEAGIDFSRAFSKGAFVPWNQFVRIERSRLTDRWIFYTADTCVWLWMTPFRTWAVDNIILDHVPSSCELIGRFRVGSRNSI